MPMDGPARISLTEASHEAVARVLKTGGVAIDATVGNGRDTEFLARTVGDGGRVYGFDIQPQALVVARERLARAGLMRRVTLFEAGHERMGDFIPVVERGNVQAAIFNLGWLPGALHQVTTKVETTLTALDAALGFLAPDGILAVVCYPGHPEGAEECVAVEHWAAALDGSRYRVERIEAAPGTLRIPPKLISVFGIEQAPERF
jgi:tRNA A58 N-methylase Trm61